MQPTTVPAFLDSDGLRALFITNECAGLGRLRRTINLARAVTEADPDATALIVTGSAALGSFVLPQRVDTVKLPVFRRKADGTLYATLGVDMPMIESMRSEILRSAAAAFDPDVVVVDMTPLGLRDELVPMLELLRERGRARIVLGLRNVEDDPARVHAAWRESDTLSAVERYYDCALVYGPHNTTSDALSCLDSVKMPVPVTPRRVRRQQPGDDRTRRPPRRVPPGDRWRWQRWSRDDPCGSRRRTAPAAGVPHRGRHRPADGRRGGQPLGEPLRR